MVTIMAYLPPSPSKGEEVDDRGQFKQETVVVKQEVADDFMASLGFGSSTDERTFVPRSPNSGTYMIGQELPHSDPS